MHNLQDMLLMPGDQLAEPIDVPAQDSVDTFGVIGHECLRSRKTDVIPCVGVDFSIIPHPP